MPDALARLRRLLPATAPEGAALEGFLPDVADGAEAGAGLRRRAALASTLVAGLEMARDGTAALAQEAPFGVVRVAPAT